MRAIAVRPAGSWDEKGGGDCVLLDAEGGHRRRGGPRAAAGAALLPDLPHPGRLRDGAALALEAGGCIRVRARPETLLEIHAPGSGALMRIAWHLGNRHLPVQVMDDGLRIRDDHVLAAMIE